MVVTRANSRCVSGADGAPCSRREVMWYAVVPPFNYPQFPAAVFDQKLNRKSLL